MRSDALVASSGVHRQQLATERYRIVREIGRGGMGVVYEARQVPLDRRVAIKVLNSAISSQPRAVARFLREARAAAQIRHAHVVQVFDVEESGPAPFMVMELCEGLDLAGLLKENGPMPVESIAEVFLPVISAIACAHEAGIIHRDLKPGNLMLTERPWASLHPVVLDFGISKIAKDDASVTNSESLLGTLAYLAPELTRGARFASAASDQYALGAMLYECCTGKKPFAGDSHYELLHSIATAPLTPPSALCAGLPPEFESFIQRAMSRDPTDRFPAVHALGAALLPFASRSVSARWRPVFLQDAAKLPDLWARSERTLADAEQAPELTLNTKVASQHSRVKVVLLVLLGVYASFATWMALARYDDRQRSTAGASERVAVRPSEQVPEAPAAAAQSAPRNAPSTWAPADGTTSRPAARPARATNIKPASSAAAVLTTLPPSHAPALGANQAPILD